MNVRRPVAEQFYSGDVAAMMDEYSACFVPPELPKKVISGIVPHAGWMFSGATAAKVFLTIKSRQTPRTFVLFGAVHTPGVSGISIYPEGKWETPLGTLSVDSSLAADIMDEIGDIASESSHAHSYEHSIEVQTPMIKHLFPEAMILPIAVPPFTDAVGFGKRAAKLVRDTEREVVFIGSTDLTHYGANYGFSPAGYGKPGHDWMVTNDKRIVELALSVDAEGILTEAAKHHNSCGAGAFAASVAAARTLGAKSGTLLEYTTSYDVYPMGEFDMGVGYAGIVF
jgi:hypothetical protein